MTKDKIKEFILENKGFISVIVLAILFRICFIPVTVQGHSMDSTLYDTEIGLVYKLDKTPDRGDIVVATNPESGDHIVKRVIGIPGDVVYSEDGYVYVNGEMIDEPYLDTENQGVTTIDSMVELQNDQYYLLGDNRTRSADSRKYGAYERKLLVGIWLGRIPVLSPGR